MHDHAVHNYFLAQAEVACERMTWSHDISSVHVLLRRRWVFLGTWRQGRSGRRRGFRVCARGGARGSAKRGGGEASFCKWRGYNKLCCCAEQRRFREDQVTQRCRPWRPTMNTWPKQIFWDRTCPHPVRLARLWVFFLGGGCPLVGVFCPLVHVFVSWLVCIYRCIIPRDTYLPTRRLIYGALTFCSSILTWHVYFLFVSNSAIWPRY